MGASATKEKEVLQKLKNLQRDKKGWREILEDLLETFQPVEHIDCKFDVKIFDFIFELFKENELSDRDRSNIFRALSKILTNSKVYKHVSASPIFDEVLQEVKHCPVGAKTDALQTLYRLVRQDTEKSKPDTEIEIKKRFIASGPHIIYHTLVESSQVQEIEALLDIIISIFEDRRSSTPVQLSTGLIQCFVSDMQVFFKMIKHPENTISTKATHALLLLILEADEAVLKRAQRFALNYAYLLILALKALDGNSSEAMWLLGILSEGEKLNTLVIKRILGHKLLNYASKNKIKLSDKFQVSELSKKLKLREAMQAESMSVRQKCVFSDWGSLYSMIAEDIEDPWVMWNETVKSQIVRCLTEDLQLYGDRIERNHDPTGTIWSPDDFTVSIPYFRKFHKVSGIYLEILVKFLESGKEVEMQSELLASDLILESCISDSPKYLELIFDILFHLSMQQQLVLGVSQQMKSLTYLLKPKDGKIYSNVYNLCCVHDALFGASVYNKYGCYVHNGVEYLVAQLARIHTMENTETKIKICGIILKLLASLSEFHKVTLLLSDEGLFPFIIQAMLVKNRDIIDQTLDLIRKILEENPDRKPTLFRYGLFHLLINSFPEGSSAKAARFLREFGKLQCSEEENYLEIFFTKPLVTILDSEPNCERFIQAMNEDVVKPDLIWRDEERSILSEYVGSQSKAFEESCRVDHCARFQYQEAPAVKFVSLDSELCLDDIYIGEFLKDPDYPIKDPEGLMVSLIERSSRAGGRELFSLLRCQKELFQRYYDRSSVFYSYSGFPVIVQALNSGDNEFISCGIDLLLQIFNGELRSFGNRDSFVNEHEGLQVVFDTFLELGENKNPQQIPKIATLLVSLASAEGAETKIEAIPGFFVNLEKIAMESRVENRGITLNIFNLFDQLCDSSIWPLVYSSGYIIFLMYAFILELENGIGDESGLYFVEKLASVQRLPEANRDITNLLTPGLANHLCTPETFIRVFKAETETPILIWNKAMRAELFEFARSNANDLLEMKPGAKYSSNEFSFQTLAPELIVDNLYVRVFNEQPEFELEKPHRYVSSIYEDLTRRANGASLENTTILMELEALEHFMSNPNFVSLVSQNERQYNSFHCLLVKSYFGNNTDALEGLLAIYKILARDSVEPQHMQHPINVLHCLLQREQFSSLYNEALDIVLYCCEKNSITKHITETGMLMRLILMLVEGSKEEKNKIVAILRLLLDKDDQANTIISRLFPKLLLSRTKDKQYSAQEIAKEYSSDHSTPLLVWNSETRSEVAECCRREVERVFPEVETQLKAKMTASWDSSRISGWRSQHLSSKLRVSGIYLHEFNENPFFKPENPKKFAKDLLKEIEIICEEYGNNESVESSSFQDSESVMIVLLESTENLLSNSPELYHVVAERLELFFEILKYFPNDARSKLLGIFDKLLKKEKFAENLIQHCYLPQLLRLLHVDKLAKPALFILEHMLLASSDTAEQMKMSGGVLYILRLVMDNFSSEEVKLQAAKLLCLLTVDDKHGEEMNAYITMFLTSSFGSQLNAKPSKFLKFFFDDHTSETREWNNETRGRLYRFLVQQVNCLDNDAFENHWDGEARVQIGQLKKVYSDAIVDERTSEEDVVLEDTTEKRQEDH